MDEIEIVDSPEELPADIPADAETETEPEVDPRTLPHKVINGLAIPLTDEEIAELESRPAPAPATVTVTMAQARKALILSGVSMMDVEAALASIPDDTARALAQVDWEYSTTVRSTYTLVDSICSVMELDKTALFALAVTL